VPHTKSSHTDERISRDESAPTHSNPAGWLCALIKLIKAFWLAVKLHGLGDALLCSFSPLFSARARFGGDLILLIKGSSVVIERVSCRRKNAIWLCFLVSPFFRSQPTADSARSFFFRAAKGVERDENW
jgi:hypothetical protein